MTLRSMPRAKPSAGLLRPHVHAHPDGVARVVIRAGGVAAAAVFVGHVVFGHAAVAIVRIPAAAVSVGYRIADGHATMAVDAIALAGLVDFASRDAAHHGADRRGSIAA